MQQTTANCSASSENGCCVQNYPSLNGVRLRFLARTRPFPIVVYLSFYVFMFSLLYILLTHTFAHTAAFIARSCALSHSHLSLGAPMLDAAGTKLLSLRYSSLPLQCACLFLLQFLVAAESVSSSSFVFLALTHSLYPASQRRNVGIGNGIANLAAANKMFICYLLKTILNKIQTMYSQSALTRTHTLSLLLASTLSICLLSLSLSFAYCRQGLPRRCSWNVFGPCVLYVLLLFCCCGWVVGLLVGSCFVVLCLWKMTPPVGMSMCVRVCVWQRRFLIG